VRYAVKELAGCDPPIPDFRSERTDADGIDESRSAPRLCLPKNPRDSAVVNHKPRFWLRLPQEFTESDAESVGHSTKSRDRWVRTALLDFDERPFANFGSLCERVKGKPTGLT
jgi:hypothetical protein